MGLLSNEKLEVILEKTSQYISPKDVCYFLTNRNTVREFVKYVNEKSATPDGVYNFLLQHEDEVDKEKIIIIAIKKCKDRIKAIETIIKDEKTKAYPSVTSKKGIKKDDEMINNELTLGFHQQYLNELKKYAKGIKTIVSRYRYSNTMGKYTLELIDPEEVIKEKKYNLKEKKARLDKIQQDIKRLNENEEDSMGIEYIIQFLNMSDYFEVFEPRAEEIAAKATCAITDNEILRTQNVDNHELENLKKERVEEYLQMVEQVLYNAPQVIKEEREMIEKYIKYVDIDKLLLISAYRFERYLENNDVEAEDQMLIKNLLEVILKNIKDKRKVYKMNLDEKNEKDADMVEVKYSAGHVKECLSRFSKDLYYSKMYIEDKREKIKNGELKFKDLTMDDINRCFDRQSILENALENEENFAYIIERFEYTKEQIIGSLIKKGYTLDEVLNYLIWNNKYNISAGDIIKLYFNNTLDIKQVITASYGIDFSTIINMKELYRIYEEKNTELLEKYILLYKQLLKQESYDFKYYSDELMTQIIENYDSEDKEKHTKTIKDFYKRGLLSFKSIVEWNDEESIKRIIQDLYCENALKLEEIKEFVKAKIIPFEYIKDLVFKGSIDYDEMKKLIAEGWMPDEEIIELYSKALIRKEDLIELAEKSIMSKRKVEKVIRETSINTLSENALGNIELDIGNLKKIKKDKDIYTNSYNVGTKEKTIRIIDPNAREELFDLLHASIIPRKEKGRQGIEVSEESPFYNYKFYGIPDEDGKITLDSIIIAERIYEDIETEERFSVDNATYFFKYGDMLVLSNYTKKGEALKELENMVFKVNHRLGAEEQNGSWGIGVIYGIVKAMLSSNMKDLTKGEKRIKLIDTLQSRYTYEELMEILEKSEEIDLGLHTYDIINDSEQYSGESR